MGVKASLAETRHRLFYGTVEKTIALGVSLYVRGSAYFVKGSGGEEMGRHNNEFGGGHGGTKVEVSDVSSTEAGVFRYSGVE